MTRGDVCDAKPSWWASQPGHGPAETAPHVRRGRNLRDVVIMRALAVERVVRAVIFTLLAVGVLAVRGTHGRLQTAFEKSCR